VNKFVRLVSIVGIGLLAQACTSPPAYMEHPKPKNTASAQTPSSGGNTAPQPTRIVLEDKSLTNEEVRQIFAMGYKPVERHGEVYYCRREVTTGSRFDEMTCRTGDEVKRLTQASKDALTGLQGVGGCKSGLDHTPAC
jgi:hypothetical protein